MKERTLLLNQSINTVGEDTTTVESEGYRYQFNPATARFLECFKSPRSLSEVMRGAQLNPFSEDADYLEGFCDFLEKKKILKRSPDKESKPKLNWRYERPIFLKKG